MSVMIFLLYQLPFILQDFFAKGGIIMFIFRASMTINGVKIYAKDYGKRAFKIWIDKKK